MKGYRLYSGMWNWRTGITCFPFSYEAFAWSLLREIDLHFSKLLLMSSNYMSSRLWFRFMMFATISVIFTQICFVGGLMFFIFVFSYAYRCSTRFPYQKMFVSFKSNTTGVTSWAGTAIRSLPVINGFRVAWCLVSVWCFITQCSSFSSFRHYIVHPSSIYYFWLILFFFSPLHCPSFFDLLLLINPFLTFLGTVNFNNKYI